jgi:hypothetical protein
MIHSLHRYLFILVLFSLIIGASGRGSVVKIARATTDGDRPDIVDLVKDEIESSKEQLTDRATETARSFVDRVSSFVYEKIGVNLAEGIKLLGQFFIWLFEALAAFTRWLLNVFTRNNG